MAARATWPGRVWPSDRRRGLNTGPRSRARTAVRLGIPAGRAREPARTEVPQAEQAHSEALPALQIGVPVLAPWARVPHRHLYDALLRRKWIDSSSGLGILLDGGFGRVGLGTLLDGGFGRAGLGILPDGGSGRVGLGTLRDRRGLCARNHRSWRNVTVALNEPLPGRRKRQGNR